MITVKYHSSRKFTDLSSALSHKMYGEIRGVNMKWVPLTSCDEYIIAGGSNLSSAGYKSHVWCSGYTASYGKTPRPLKLHSVRGPMSQNRAKAHMNVTTPCAGDPLLLIADMYEILDEAIIPCVFTRKKLSGETIAKLGPCRNITVSDGLETILTSVKNSSFVITELYEGLVLADAYRRDTAYVSKGSVPFVVKDYLENFDYDSQRICDDLPESLANFVPGAARDITRLRNTLLKTIPSI